VANYTAREIQVDVLWRRYPLQRAMILP